MVHPFHFPTSVGIPATSLRKALLPLSSHPTTRTSDLQTLVRHHHLRSGALSDHRGQPTVLRIFLLEATFTRTLRAAGLYRPKSQAGPFTLALFRTLALVGTIPLRKRSNPTPGAR